MTLLFFLACALLCASKVFANVEAGAYQTLWLWYAYQMDGMTSNPTMALGCEPKNAPGGRCYFDDFLKYIDDPTRQTIKDENGKPRTVFATWQGSTSVGENLTPDVDETVNELKTQGTAGDASTRYQNKPNNDKLFSDIDKPHTFSKVHQRVMDAVQAARRELGDDKLATQLAAARKSLSAIHVARLVDQANEMTPAFKNEIQQRGIMNAADVPVDKLTAPDGTTYETVKTEEVVANGKFNGKNAEAIQAKKDFITNFKSNYDAGNLKGGQFKGAKGHAAAVSAAQALERRINGPPDC